METVWKIRPNVVWQDGTPFTASDLLFTAEVVRDRDFPLSRNIAYGAMDEVTALDDLSSGGGGDVGWLQRLYGNQAPVPENKFAGRNKGRYTNAAFDSLLDQFFTTVPKGDRMAVLSQIVSQVSDPQIVMGLFYSAERVMISHKLRNLNGKKATLAATSWNANDWALIP